MALDRTELHSTAPQRIATCHVAPPYRIAQHRTVRQHITLHRGAPVALLCTGPQVELQMEEGGVMKEL
eukprot:2169278-Lingulodinium_polyedra.AAC.1